MECHFSLIITSVNLKPPDILIVKHLSRALVMVMNDSVKKEPLAVFKSIKSSIFFRINFFIISTLVIALLMNMILSVLTLEKIYSKSLLSEYTVIGRYYARKIERSLSFGKNLSNFSGMPKFLNEFEEKNPDINQIFIYSDKQKPLFRLHGRMDFSKSAISQNKLSQKEKLFNIDKNYHLVFPLFSGGFVDKSFQGYMEIVLFQSLIEEKIKLMINAAGKLLTIVATSSAFAFFIIVLIMIPSSSKTKGRSYSFSLKTRLLLITSLVLIPSQIGFSYFNVADFRERYIQNIQEKCHNLGKLLQYDINYLLDLGIPIDKLKKIDLLLNDILHNISELSNITIVDSSDTVLYQVQKPDKTKAEYPDTKNHSSDYNLRVNNEYRIPFIAGKVDQPAGFIHLNISPVIINNTIQNLIFDAATVVVVSLLIGFEFVFFLVAYIVYSDKKTYEGKRAFFDNRRASEAQIEIQTSLRTAAFLYAFAMALSMSFLPIYANELYASVLGLSREIVIALPISAEMLFVALSFLVGGYWLDRQGWFWPFITGAVITGGGVWLCGIANNTTELIVYRAIVGFGYGLAVMSTQSVVINMTTIENRSSAVAAIEAGFFSGFISSTAVGGMLAEKIGFRSVFFVGGIFSIVSILFVAVFLRDIRKAGCAEKVEKERVSSAGSVLSLFKDKVFLGSLILSAIPASLCLVGFLHYASLLFLSQAGVSQSNIARLIMPYGLCMVYIAPTLSRWTDSVKNKRIPVIIGGIIGGISLMAFYFIDSIPLFVLVLVLFSISGGLSYGARVSGVSESHEVKNLGVGKSLGLFNSFERVGNIIGPIIVGGMIAAIGLSSAISSIGLIYFAGTIFFAGLFFRKKASFD